MVIEKQINPEIKNVGTIVNLIQQEIMYYQIISQELFESLYIIMYILPNLIIF